LPFVVGDDRLAARAVVERRQDAQPLGAAHTSLNRPMRHPERPSNRVTDGVSRYSSSFCATRPGWPALLSFRVTGISRDRLKSAAKLRTLLSWPRGLLDLTGARRDIPLGVAGALWLSAQFLCRVNAMRPAAPRVRIEKRPSVQFARGMPGS
jgi:hypothetical protein